ncbi:MAG: metallophosphoesterase [Candidatus Riflebacteria bacterium]|nr:metallophosphoesterase [Candidatus Riflebacteria bacterium]
MIWLFAGLVALALVWSYRGFLVEPWRIERSVLRLPVPNLPPGLIGKRILFLSDLHTQAWGYRELFVAEVLRRRPPDLVIVTGDLISSPVGVPVVLELFGPASPPMGIFFVRGNNEIEELPDPDAFAERLRGLGWTVLCNEHRVIDDPAGRFCIAGVDDPNNRRDDLAKALHGIPHGMFTLLLSHTPEPFLEAAGRGVELVLAGHTHGGQVRLPGIGALWTDTPRCGRRYSAGVYREGGATMVVHRGIGWSVLPLRLYCPPEVLELELVPPTSDESSPPGRGF